VLPYRKAFISPKNVETRDSLATLTHKSFLMFSVTDLGYHQSSEQLPVNRIEVQGDEKIASVKEAEKTFSRTLLTSRVMNDQRCILNEGSDGEAQSLCCSSPATPAILPVSFPLHSLPFLRCIKCSRVQGNSQRFHCVDC
jgi:hypothetical protein